MRRLVIRLNREGTPLRGGTISRRLIEEIGFAILQERGELRPHQCVFMRSHRAKLCSHHEGMAIVSDKCGFGSVLHVAVLGSQLRKIRTGPTLDVIYFEPLARRAELRY